MRKHTSVLAVAALVALAGCTTKSSSVTAATSAATLASDGASTSAELTRSDTLTVVTHDSFALSDEVKKQFESDTGIQVTYVAPGDAGTVTNQIILTKDAPLGDVVFGIDNTFAGRVIKAGVLSPYVAPGLPTTTADLGPRDDLLTPIDYGDVCVNADKKWFADKGIALPKTLDDLAAPAYKDQLVVENPASSSPGLAFLAATVGAKGDPGYLDYWSALTANGVKVAKGWTEAYTGDFSGSSGKGPRPLVVSYSTSPAFEVPKGGKESATVALLDTCFRQVEYAGVIKGAQNEVGAQKFIDYLLTKTVQAEIPGQMYMYPVDSSVELPADWVKFAPLAPKPIAVDPTTIADKREQWIKDWTAKVLG
ncbi:thiamine ABC transporter substrate-binding protein [Nostocoides vanveenii]|uniref:Thiamine ABC transporter substrate-binding protein n=1 Tax=Nostocoides vanveenii TaxID=330835 RepID=A0ABN2KUN2_9MICO